jgi:hypothetical protein
MQLRAALGSALLLALLVPAPAAQDRITTPKEHFGFDLGDDYMLANYQQLAEFWRKLAAESDRMVLEDIGRTAEGRPHLMAIVTSPANHANLAFYKSISQRLALARDLTEEDARSLARQGRAVVWIDGGLHATETLGAQQLAQMVYEMTSRTDDETMRFLDETIVLFVHANPDGHDLVADWYMRHAEPERRTTPGCRGSTRSTSATTTTGTSSPRRRPRPRTSIASCITNGCRRFCTTTTRAGRPERSYGRRRSAIRTTTTWIRCSSSACRRSARTCTSGWPPKTSPARRWPRGAL